MKIIIAGGGTAGHVLPAIAVADEIKRNFESVQILFIGAKGGADEQLVPKSNYSIRYIPKSDFPRKINLSVLSFIPRFILAVLKSLLFLRGAEVAIGFGGYVATPVYVAARILGIPIAIHEANAIPGLANKVGYKWAKVVAVSGSVQRWNKENVVGFPMRKAITDATKLRGAELLAAKTQARIELGLPTSGKVLLIIGGSLGARQINKAIEEIVPQIIQAKISILHLTGVGDSDSIAEINYKRISYLAEMNLAYLAADFVIARAGAGTCAEIEAMALPVIFVPLPIGNGEQVANAHRFVEMGSAKILLNSDCTSQNLLKLIFEVDNSLTELTQIAIVNRSVKLSAAADFVRLITTKILQPQKIRKTEKQKKGEFNV